LPTSSFWLRNARPPWRPLDYTTLRAPFDGVTGLLQIEIGNLTQPRKTTGIVVLTQVQPIAVVFILPQSDIAPVQAAMARGPVQATVCDQSGSKQLDIGKLLAINNQADQANSQAEFSEELANCRGGARKKLTVAIFDGTSAEEARRP
jgi:membrane fusion protein, multidrug efflux system